MKTSELVRTASECFGCGACVTVCGVNAIRMEENEDGFFYPVINERLCVDCGRCAALCRQQSSFASIEAVQAYAAFGRDESLVNNSASGGIFASLANSHLQHEGRIAGAVMQWHQDGPCVHHMLSAAHEDLRAMQGSKYVQSKAWKSYPDIMTALARGEKVLFCGTPCQCAAVQKLTGNPVGLITMDLICHGVPSEKMFREYLTILSKHLNMKLNHFVFRDKTCKKDFCASVNGTRGKHRKQLYISANYLSFYQLFLKGLIYRESCYACPYAKLERISDITVGDYWGIEDVHREEFKNGLLMKRRDWSCLLVNTDKGKAFLAEYGGTLTLTPSKPEWAAKRNGQLNAPSQLPSDREKLLMLYRATGYAGIERRFMHRSGSWLRYYWRLYRNIHVNKKLSDAQRNKG